MRSQCVKRIIDVLVASAGIVLFFPLMVVIALAIWCKMGRPIIYRQMRPGLHGRPFVLYKFRTMTNAVDANGQLLPDEQRLTRLGRWLRTTSLDELPELWNVLKGDMSIVGPRPLLMEYLDRYTPEQARRHEVKPGITGWAQINGRNRLSWEEKFRFDIWYVDNWTVWLDVKIMLLTIIKVLRREGINASGYATAPKFGGSARSELQ